MLKRLKEILLFCLSGLIGYFFDVFVTLLTQPIFGVYLSRVPAFLVAATVTWALNRNVTFRERRSVHKRLVNELAHYYSLMLGGLIVNFLTYSFVITFLDKSTVSIFFAVGVGSIAGLIVNYTSSRRYIFSNPKS